MTNSIENTAVSRSFLTRAAATFDERHLKDLLDILRTKKLEITVGTTPISSLSWLGSGGYKAVHDVEIEDEHYALTLPNAIHDSFVLMKQWSIILNEAENTNKMREMGFYTNSLSEIVQTNINGIPFPALLMHRYRDLPFEIRDNKNPISSTGNTRILPPEVLLGSIPGYLKPFAEDIRRLIANNVHVGPESVNLCVVNEEPHLYFNDLGMATFESISEETKEKVIHSYAHDAISAMTRGITEKEYKESKQYLRERHDYLVEALSAEVTSGM